MAGRDWSEKSDSSIEEKLCVCVWGEEGGGRRHVCGEEGGGKRDRHGCMCACEVGRERSVCECVCERKCLNKSRGVCVRGRQITTIKAVPLLQ